MGGLKVGRCGAGLVANGLESPFQVPCGVVFGLRNTKKGIRLFSPAGPEIGLFPDEMLAKCVAVALSEDDLFAEALGCGSPDAMRRRLRPLVEDDLPIRGA